jgi:hypothetical protein
MKKWTLILAISCLILVMLGFPGLYDSKAMAEAHRQHRDAPSEQTRQELQDAKASDRWHILTFKVAFGGVLAVLFWALLRTEKNVHESVA